MTSQISKIRKRDGRIVDFEPHKIENAIKKTMTELSALDENVAKKITENVMDEINTNFYGKTPGIEDVQDIVEKKLMEQGLPEVAKAYILYRKKRSEIREAKRFLGVEDELKLTFNAISVLERRYLLKNESGKVIETPSQMFHRIAKAVASTEAKHYLNKATQNENEFYEIMSKLEFLPNSPTIMNAGTKIGQLSACYVLPVPDSIYGIFNTVRDMAIIHQSGGGTGFSFSQLRPRGDFVGSTGGVASGPLSFMRVFDTSTDVIKQGGRRRGANMAILKVDHPDIIEFITSKEKEGFLTNFNLSVAITDSFMKAVEKDTDFELVNPHTSKVIIKTKARNLWTLIITSAWKTGDPGLVFIDEINRHNPTPEIGTIESTNPCGEQPLLPYESCNLGSINIAKFVDKQEIDWESLGIAVKKSVNFLDNVIDVNKFPTPEVEKITKANRKIGLGIMGFADALLKMKIPYDSKEALKSGEKIMKFIQKEGHKASIEIGERKGSFPNFNKSIWKNRGYKTMRNATVTTIAPTGTIGIIAGVSSGIEPLFAIAFIRNVMGGTQLTEVNSEFEKTAKKRGFYSQELIRKIARTGSIRDIEEIPEDIKKLFVTAFDISPEWHVKIQATFQKYVDNAVSKTINFSAEATPDDVEKAYWMAYKMKCKGITVYRYGSKTDQVLTIGSMTQKKSGGVDYVSVESEYSGGCPTTCSSG
ncbi:ribonucleoside-diphosphate reductase, adenosylcobalamin-dependent [Candidatus Bathyarchaeota archaeon RBG_13_38_9]|nr:MAG: ribonucleoside-diphosphate reductase, adenosylcobalamin-dependent [Candidatus Bathyarchaeota archaeon RBG_13_38_9]